MDSNKTIIYLEDRTEDVLLIKRIIKKNASHLNLISYTDTDEFLSDLNKGIIQEKRPCLFLLDIKMPKKSGIEISEILGQMESLIGIPRVLLSSSVQPKDIYAGYASGAHGYVEKASSLTQLTSDLLRVFDYWTGLNIYRL